MGRNDNEDREEQEREEQFRAQQQQAQQDAETSQRGQAFGDQDGTVNSPVIVNH